MIRATTPTHSFRFKTDPHSYSRLLITYAQGKQIVLEKELTDLYVERIESQDEYIYLASFKFSQNESRGFVPVTPVKIQVRALAADGTAYASKIFTVRVQDVLNDEVLV